MILSMNTALQPFQERVQKIGKLLWIFTICWLVFNAIALCIMVATVIGLGIAGRSEHRETIINMFSQPSLIPGVNEDAMKAIVSWDYDSYIEHLWLTAFLAIAASAFFVATMIFILKIARAMMKGDILSHPAIKSMHILGWLYLVQGTIGQLWGMAGQFIAHSNTADILYFSFIRDACLYSFSFSGSGIEWGLLVLAISWILKHARQMRDEQLLVV